MTRLERTVRTLARTTVAGLFAAGLYAPLCASAAPDAPAPLKLDGRIYIALPVSNAVRDRSI